MRVYCRPGATPLERLEAYLAFCLRAQGEAAGRVADLLVAAVDPSPPREAAIRQLFQSPLGDPAEALGAARAVLILCGLLRERGRGLTGDPRRDLARLVEGEHLPLAPPSPESYEAPDLLEGYCYLGASFARGMDAVFGAVTGRGLEEHLSRALGMLEPSARSA